MYSRFIKPASTTLDATGRGTAFVTAPSGVTWHVRLLSVSTTGVNAPGVSQPVATVYFGTAANPSQFVETTFFGNGDSSDSTYPIFGGESVCVEWVGGTPGASATMTVRGDQEQ